jgi:hypothetical protein
MSGWLDLQARAEERYRQSPPERGFFNTVANGHFRSLDDEITNFYPQGMYGRSGFVISSAEQEMLLRRHAREYRLGLSIVCFIVSVAFGSFFQRMEFWQHMTWIVGFIAADWVFARVYFGRFTRKMEPADVPNSPVVQWRSMGHTMHPLLLILQTTLVAGLAGASLYFFVTLREPILLLFGVLMATGLAPFVIALRSWWRTRMET